MKMKKMVNYFLLFSLFFIIGGCGTTTKQQTSLNSVTPAKLTDISTTTLDIAITDFAFSPEIVKIKKGTTVTWKNYDQVSHRIKSSLFSSGLINTGQIFSFTFNEIGSVDYYCSIHPSMNGKIVIE